MTLQSFLRLTSTTPTPVLRQAISVALSAERPTSRESYARFYSRVVDQLGLRRGARPRPTTRAHIAAA